MQIINQKSSSSSFTPHSTEKFQTPSTLFYESSCKEMSCNQKPLPCCISNFFKKMGTIITYPFVKLYQAILALIGKKTAESSEKPNSRHSSNEQEAASSVANSERESIEASDLEETSFRFDPTLFNEDYFYQKGVQGFTTLQSLLSSIADPGEQNDCCCALGSKDNFVDAWKKGIAFYLGQNNQPLTEDLANNEAYQQAYANGQAADRKSELAAPPTTPTSSNPASDDLLTEDFIYSCGQNGVKTLDELATYLQVEKQTVQTTLDSAPRLRSKWEEGIAYHFGAINETMPDYIPSNLENIAAYLKGTLTLTHNYDEGNYLQNERFTEQFFYQAGKNGLEHPMQLYNTISDLAGKKALAHALHLNSRTQIAWNKGIAFYYGKNNIPLPDTMSNAPSHIEYKKEYRKGSAASNKITP